MRKNTPRKWIHAILDLLPLLVIPIFAIYSQRHEINNNVVNRTEDVFAYPQNMVINGLPTSLDNIHSYGDLTLRQVVHNEELNMTYVEALCTVEDGGGFISFDTGEIDIIGNHKYYLSFLGGNSTYSPYEIEVSFNENAPNYINISDTVDYYSQIVNLTDIESDTLTSIWFDYTLRDGDSYESLYIGELMFVDLTSLYGVGNEPTAEDFDNILNRTFVPFENTTFKVNVGIQTVTFNDTDIGSQFLYQLYNVTDKYFNFNNLFNMGDIYSWLNNNLFGGNAPLPVTIVWNIIVYEFFVDLIFLLYSVFMFIIDFATNMIDSFTRRNK